MREVKAKKIGLVHRVIKLSLIIMVALFIIMAITLKLVESQPEQLKVGFEGYLTQKFGYPAEIGAVEKAKFFPIVHLHFINVRLWPLDDPEGTVLHVDDFETRLPLWSLFLPTRPFDMFSVRSLSISKTLTGFADVTMDSLLVNAQTQTLEAEGALDDMRYTVSAPINIEDGASFTLPEPPVRISGTLEGGRTKGSYFIDINGQDDFGAVATFERYRAQDIEPLRAFMEQRLIGTADRTFPAQLHIEKIAGVPGGPYIFEPLRLENGALQPLACLAKHQGRAPVGDHPCARYRALTAQEDE